MPRAKADTVQIHRIELGGYERKLADQLLFSQVARTVPYAAAGLAIAAGAGVMAYAGYWTLREVWKWGDKADDWLDKKKEELEEALPEILPEPIQEGVVEPLAEQAGPAMGAEGEQAQKQKVGGWIIRVITWLT